MSLLEKLQTFIMLGAVGLGLGLGRWEVVARLATHFITPALTAMLFGLFLSIPLSDLKKGLADRKFALTSLAINFIWIPIFGWLLGGLFLADQPALRLGFIMLLVTPCTDWYLVFTGIARGNVALSAAILPVNLIVQVILLPFYLFVFAGLTGYVDLTLLLKSVFLVLAVPFGLSRLVRDFLAERSRVRLGLEKVFGQGQFTFLCLAIAAMFASQAPYLTGHLDIFFRLLIPVLIFFAANFVLVRFVARLLNFSSPNSVSLSLTTLARNSPIALAIAVTAFPTEPQVALVLVIGPLIELPVLGAVSQVLLYLGRKKL